ncbi:MAG: hypothetical protein E7259_02685 [Lachnospiraceae bacterium]|nr:hypothetical protein [Lachnospiraceae bacterium]
MDFGIELYRRDISGYSKKRKKRLRRIKAYFFHVMKISFFFIFIIILCVFLFKATMKFFSGKYAIKGDNVMSSGIFYTMDCVSFNIENEEVAETVVSIDDLYAGDYPESLINLYENNPETKDFVLNYKYYKDEDYIDISNDIHEGQIPLFLQWDERWGYKSYGNDFLAVTGCGPTCLSMVYCGLTGDNTYNPYEVAKLAEERGYYVEGNGSSWEMMSSLANFMGLSVHEVIFDEAHIIQELTEGRPIICVVGAGHFTKEGHFIVMYGLDENGNILIHDPNSKINSKQSWSLEDIMSEILNLWSYSY